MISSCPSTMCDISAEHQYDESLALDSQSDNTAKEQVFKFDDQPMSTFFLEGQVYIDNFVIGNTENSYKGDDAKVDKLKFVGIKRLFDTNDKPFPYKESVSGIMGFAPPSDDQISNNRHFLMQLKEKEIIDNLIFAISMDSRENFKNANIQVGSYSPGYIKEGEQL